MVTRSPEVPKNHRHSRLAQRLDCTAVVVHLVALVEDFVLVGCRDGVGSKIDDPRCWSSGGG